MTTVEGIDAKLIVDPRIDLDEKPTYLIEKAGEYIRYRTEPSQSSSGSSINFSIIPPNKNIVCDKKFYIDLDATFVFSGDAGAGNLLMPADPTRPTELVGETDALRWMPLQSVTESLSITFNQSTVSQNMADYIEALARTGFSQDFETSDMSIAPSMHDQFQEYSDATIYGGARNPLVAYGQNSAQQPRGAFNYEIVTNTQTDATVRVQWSEMIMMSPLLFSKIEAKGFVGLTNIDVTFNLGDLTRMWSHDATTAALPTPLSVDSVTFSTFPQMRLCYITPLALSPIPLVNKYPYHEISRYPTDIGNIAGGASTSVSAQNVQLSSIPKRIYVFARQRNLDRSFTQSDVYARIDGLEMQFDNKNALLGSARSTDLYEMSVRNGLKLSWMQWSKHTGSVCVIDFAHDVSLDAAQAVGERGQFQLQLNVDLTNTSVNTKNYSLYMVVVSEGVFVIADTQSSLSVGNVRPLNVLEAEQQGIERIPWRDAYDFQGGSFLGNLKKWGKRLLPYVHKALPYVKKAVQLGERYLPEAAALLAAGQTGAGVTGAGLTGGARAPRRRLRDRM